MALPLIPGLWLSGLGWLKPSLHPQLSLKEGSAGEDESVTAWNPGYIVASPFRISEDDRWSADSSGKSRLD